MKFTRDSLLLAISLVLAACQTSKPPPAIQMSDLTPKEKRLIAATPIIDIHTHTFNSRFLPLREICLGKRDKLGFSSLFVTDSMVLALVHYITWATEENHPSSTQQSDENIARLTTTTLEKEGTQVTAADIQADPGIIGAKLLVEKHKTFTDLDPTQQRSLQQFSAYFSDHPSILPDRSDSSNEIRHFLSCITAPSDRLESMFQNDHKSADGKKYHISLAASHMMDLAPTYDQTEDDSPLYPFQSRQIPLMQDQQRAANGRLLYFVAYNPFRDSWDNDPLAKPGHALDIVKTAYEKQGAFGVKIYPPSGYAPAGNSIISRPWAISPQPRRQWRARYRPDKHPAVTNQDLDQRLYDLCLWAVKNDVPLFTHCGQGEFEARRGYHELANPNGWLTLLQKHPELSELRLCLGHAGGGSEWYDAQDATRWSASTWGSTIYQLCRDYPNIYCEFGCFDDISDPAKRANFSTHLTQLIADSQKPAPPGRIHCDFSEKILYGSDWFMPLQQSTNRLNYILSFQTAIYHAAPDQPDALFKNFFYRNALRFLASEKRIARGGLPGPLVAKLRQLAATQ